MSYANGLSGRRAVKREPPSRADRKIGGTTLRSNGQIADLQRIKDSETASLRETYIDDTEKRTWFLFEASRSADRTGH